MSRRVWVAAVALVGLSGCAAMLETEQGTWTGQCVLDRTWDIELGVLDDRGTGMVAWGALVVGDARYAGELYGDSLGDAHFGFEQDDVEYRVDVSAWGSDDVREGDCELTNKETGERLDGELFIER